MAHLARSCCPLLFCCVFSTWGCSADSNIYRRGVWAESRALLLYKGWRVASCTMLPRATQRMHGRRCRSCRSYGFVAALSHVHGGACAWVVHKLKCPVVARIQSLFIIGSLVAVLTTPHTHITTSEVSAHPCSYTHVYLTWAWGVSWGFWNKLALLVCAVCVHYGRSMPDMSYHVSTLVFHWETFLFSRLPSTQLPTVSHTVHIWCQ